MRQQPPFPVHSSSIAREVAVGADNAVTGNDDGYGIACVGQTDRPARTEVAELAGNLAIGGGRTVRDEKKLLPNLFFEVRPLRIELEVEAPALKAEVLLELTYGRGAYLIGCFGHGCAAFGERHPNHSAVFVDRYFNRSDGRVQPPHSWRIQEAHAVVGLEIAASTNRLAFIASLPFLPEPSIRLIETQSSTERRLIYHAHRNAIQGEST